MLFLFLLLTSDPLQDGISLSKNGKYEESEAILSKINPKTTNSHLLHFFRLVNNFSLNNKKGVLEFTDKLDTFNLSLPFRYKVLIDLMKDEVEDWKDGDLADISRNMKRSEQRLRNSKSGKETQKIQKEVVDALDKLIKQLEKKEESNKQKASEAEKKSAEKEKTISPQKDSEARNDSGPGKIDYKKIQETQKVWGKLPNRERESIMRDITRDMSPRYREIIMEYMKRLSTLD